MKASHKYHKDKAGSKRLKPKSPENKYFPTWKADFLIPQKHVYFPHYKKTFSSHTHFLIPKLFIPTFTLYPNERSGIKC